MSFTNDEKWNTAKQIAKREGKGVDWCYIVTLYNCMGGNQIAVYVTYPEESAKYRVLGVTDQGKTLIEPSRAEDKISNYQLIDSEEAFKMKKIFETHDFKHTLNSKLVHTTILGEPKLVYGVERKV